MNLLEKRNELLAVKKTVDELTGTKVIVNINGEDIEGNFRHFQSNGYANIYLKNGYTTPKGKTSQWIKLSPTKVLLA